MVECFGGLVVDALLCLLGFSGLGLGVFFVLLFVVGFRMGLVSCWFCVWVC